MNTQLLPATDFGPTTFSRPRRRWPIWRYLATACAAALLTVAGTSLAQRDSGPDVASPAWPVHGQAAYQIGSGPAVISAGERPVPIASLAKVMTARVVLQLMPLTDGQDGPTYTVTARDVEDTMRRAARDESVVSLDEGERLTERQALIALLLPSANNVAAILARWSAGGQPHFVALMNEAADDLGMAHTTYTDPSGYDDATVSTAADQLLLAEDVADDPVLAELMRLRSADLPFVGTVHNTDTLLGSGGFVGMKTGSTDAAGGCFMFHALRVVDGRSVDLIGVVLGQPGKRGQPLSRAGLTAARQLANLVAPGVRHP